MSSFFFSSFISVPMAIVFGQMLAAAWELATLMLFLFFLSCCRHYQRSYRMMDEWKRVFWDEWKVFADTVSC